MEFAFFRFQKVDKIDSVIIALQRGNAVSFQNTMIMSEAPLQPYYIAYFNISACWLCAGGPPPPKKNNNNKRISINVT